MTARDEYGRRLTPPSTDPRTQAIGRAICTLLDLNPDAVVQGVTGAMWVQWDRVALHRGKQFQAALTGAGFAVVPVKPTSAMLDAAQQAWTPGMNHADAHTERYRAMVAAAEPPSDGEGASYQESR
jgi:hypothetical protein